MRTRGAISAELRDEGVIDPGEDAQMDPRVFFAKDASVDNPGGCHGGGADYTTSTSSTSSSESESTAMGAIAAGSSCCEVRTEGGVVRTKRVEHRHVCTVATGCSGCGEDAPSDWNLFHAFLGIRR